MSPSTKEPTFQKPTTKRPPRNWVRSDDHFGHKNIIRLAERPFSDLEEMHQTILNRWRLQTEDQDTTYHLGDVFWNSINFGQAREILSSIKGRKVLILGNHDHELKEWYLEVGFHEVHDKPILYDGCVILSHQPIWLPTSDFLFKNIHGHIHQHTVKDDRYANVSVEQTDYRCLDLDALIVEKKWKTSKAVDFLEDRVWVRGRPSRDETRFTLKEFRQLKADGKLNVEFVFNVLTEQDIKTEDL